LLGMNYWQAVGVTFLVILCVAVSQFIPIVGILASLLLTQVFYGGLYFFFVKMSRGEETVIGDGFSGFSIAFGQLVLLSLVMNLLIGIVMLPAVLPIVGMALWQWDPWVMVPLTILLALPAIYLNIAWMLAAILVIDRGLEFWDAMELSRTVVSKHWFSVFFTVFLAGILAGLGVIGLGIGLIFTMPIIFATIAIVYSTLFPSE
ncbi:MAG TPA: hypothetical protein VMN03_00525, partial [Burkholderiales bacterium]|nr:hypothetical protein [Burkholderiales bacterium]